MSVPKLYQWIQALSFRAFLVAFLITLIGLSLIGRWCSQQNPYQNFVRFHQLTHPEALYYPTISQLRAIAKEQLQDRNKIGVIVGGSSVFNGVGQTPSTLWSKYLQELLGDRFQVINFAFRAGNVQGGGAIAAQSLLNEGYKIIFTADTSPYWFLSPIDGGKVYGYFLWDAVYKGLLKGYPPLLREVPKLTFDRDSDNEPNNAYQGELRLRMLLDSIFYFNDLWTTIGYKYFFSVWNQLIAGSYPAESFTKPRSQTIDPETNYQPKPFPERYKFLEDTIGQDLIEHEHAIIKKSCNQLYEWRENRWMVNQAKLNELDHQAQITFPKAFRSHTFLVLTYRSPYYFETMESRYGDCWQQGMALLVKRFQKAGYLAIEVGKDFSAEDFNDGVHFVASGGIKLAETVAPKIQQIAASLGYLK